MTVNSSIKLKVFSRDKYKCVECGSGDDITIDHIVPTSKGGSDLLDNLQTLCKVCNMKKGNSHTTFWQSVFDFVRPIELEAVKKDILNLVRVNGKSTIREYQSITDKRLADIQPKVEKYIDDLLQDKPVANVGLKNSIEAYARRSLERDKYLRRTIRLLCDKVEELEKRLDLATMTPQQRDAEMDFRDF